MFTLNELARHVDGQVYGDGECKIKGVGTLQDAHTGQISFLSNPRYSRQLSSTRASAVIIEERHKLKCFVNAIFVDDPYSAYARIALLLNPEERSSQGRVDASAVVSEKANIHPQAVIGPLCVIEDEVTLHAGVNIGPGCVICKHSVIDEGSRLEANVTIWHDTQIGKRALIHSGVVIGTDGFGIAEQSDGSWIKVPQLGRVRLGDDVEVGANTCIDRGALNDTVIEDGVKIDNLIQIGHNVHIGAHTVIAASTAIAGSAKIGKNCKIAGCVAIAGHLEITDNVIITGRSTVLKSITKPGIYSSGTLLETNSTWHKNVIRLKQLDELAKRVAKLESDKSPD